MKKFLMLIAALIVTLSLAGCTSKVPAEVTMDDVDEYLGRADVQYVDLRNFDDKMAAGWVSGFEFIPFFDYIEYSDILVRDGDWTFEADEIHNQSALEGLFDKDKTIFLMCGSGTRAGYVMDALLSIGYTNVINVGGIADYAGDNKVLGDGEYKTQPQVSGSYTPGTYFGFNDAGTVSAVVVINPNGGIAAVGFDALDTHGDGESKRSIGTAYGMKDAAFTTSEYYWYEQVDMLGAAVVANQGFDWTLVTHTDGDGNVSDAVYFGTDGVAGVTISVDAFETALEAALTAATPAE